MHIVYYGFYIFMNCLLNMKNVWTIIRFNTWNFWERFCWSRSLDIFWRKGDAFFAEFCPWKNYCGFLPQIVIFSFLLYQTPERFSTHKLLLWIFFSHKETPKKSHSLYTFGKKWDVHWVKVFFHQLLKKWNFYAYVEILELNSNFWLIN